jgi:hypothetical protein
VNRYFYKESRSKFRVIEKETWNNSAMRKRPEPILTMTIIKFNRQPGWGRVIHGKVDFCSVFSSL